VGALSRLLELVVTGFSTHFSMLSNTAACEGALLLPPAENYSCIAHLERPQICKYRLNRGDSNHRWSQRLPLELSLGSGANALLLLQRGPEKTTFP
jgi:hypothetical protein